jgi:FAS-associated factor 2
MDISSLSESQQIALQQFTSVTDQDLSTAVPILQKCQWNAQIAITRFFDGDAETVDPAAEAARAPPPATDSRRSETLMDGIPTRSRPRSPNDAASSADLAPRIVPPPESQRIQPLPFPFSILLLPVNLSYAIFSRVFGVIGYLFPFLPRLIHRLYSGRTSQPSRDTGRRPLNPRDTAARFMREFEEEYGVPPNTLPFHEGGYASAFDIAKRDLKYLMIVLLSPEHDDNGPFVRDTLLSTEFVEFMNAPQNKNDIILWAGTVQDAEAYTVASALNVTRFPYTVLMVYAPSISNTALKKISTTAGLIPAPDLVGKIQTAMQNHTEELNRVRRQKQEQEATRNLRQEQESAYERSLAQDREKARRKKAEAEEKEKVEREERERLERKEDEKRKLAQWRRWRAQTLPAEPGSEVKDAVRVSLRMMDAQRVIRKFRAEADLEELYAFVECYDIVDGEEQVSEKEVPEPEGYEHEYKFRLVSPMPREVYDLDKAGSIGERIGRSGNLIVEKVIEEDDEEDEEAQ